MPPPLILFSPFSSDIVIGVYPDEKYSGHLRIDLSGSHSVSISHFLSKIYPENPTQNQALHNHLQEHFPEYLV